jgi:hypothetical protein
MASNCEGGKMKRSIFGIVSVVLFAAVACGQDITYTLTNSQYAVYGTVNQAAVYAYISGSITTDGTGQIGVAAVPGGGGFGILPYDGIVSADITMSWNGGSSTLTTDAYPPYWLAAPALMFQGQGIMATPTQLILTSSASSFNLFGDPEGLNDFSISLSPPGIMNFSSGYNTPLTVLAQANLSDVELPYVIATADPVPEPSTWALLLTFAVCVFWRRVVRRGVLSNGVGV